MKFFVDLSKKQLIKSAASNVALERLVLKRRDSLAVEIVFVSRNAVAAMPAGTTTSVALKKSFADSNFLASASGTPPILNLNTVPLEAAFSTNPASLTALLEIRWTVPGETTRTATLQAEIQNSVILGTEATPEAIPDGKATQAQAEAGTDNTKWLTPLRTFQAIAAWVSANLQTALNAESQARSEADADLSERIDFITANLDPTALDSISEAAATINTERSERIAGDAALDAKITSLTTSDIASASVYFDIAGSHPSINGSYDVWDIDNNGRFRWANSNAAAEGASWTALRWNSNRWELGTYSAFTTWTPLYFHASESVIPPATGWQAVTGNTQPVPTLQWFSQPTADEITFLHTENTRLQKQLDEQGGIASSWIQALSENTTAALALKANASTVATLTEDFVTLSTTVSELEVNSIAGLPAALDTLSSDLAATQAAIPSPVTAVTTTHLGNGTQALFTVSGLVSANPSLLIVTINGVRQTPSVDYTVQLVSGGILLDQPLPSGDLLVVTALTLYSPPPPRDPLGQLHASDTDSTDPLVSYYGKLNNSDLPAAPALPETSSAWSITRLTLDNSGRVASRTRATGSWASRETLAYQ